jgi:hypothetical protein
MSENKQVYDGDVTINMSLSDLPKNVLSGLRGNITISPVIGTNSINVRSDNGYNVTYQSNNPNHRISSFVPRNSNCEISGNGISIRPKDKEPIDFKQLVNECFANKKIYEHFLAEHTELVEHLTDYMDDNKIKYNDFSGEIEKFKADLNIKILSTINMFEQKQLNIMEQTFEKFKSDIKEISVILKPYIDKLELNYETIKAQIIVDYTRLKVASTEFKLVIEDELVLKPISAHDNYIFSSKYRADCKKILEDNKQNFLDYEKEFMQLRLACMPDALKPYNLLSIEQRVKAYKKINHNKLYMNWFVNSEVTKARNNKSSALIYFCSVPENLLIMTEEQFKSRYNEEFIKIYNIVNYEVGVPERYNYIVDKLCTLWADSQLAVILKEYEDCY